VKYLAKFVLVGLILNPYSFSKTHDHQKYLKVNYTFSIFLKSHQ